MAQLKSRVAIVTGAARGIGLAIAERLKTDRCQVVMADLDFETVAREADRLGQGTTPVDVDVARPESCERMVSAALERWGRVDVLVNNAGIAGPAAPAQEYPLDAWRRVMAVNLDGVFFSTRAVLPHMLQRGSGHIVNVASIAGKEGNPNMPAYSASKAGVIGLTKSLAKEVARSGILVNCITPAVVETDLLRQLTPDTVQYMVSKIPVGRVGTPRDVASMVAWLSSAECSFSTGAVFDISGGRATY